LRNETGDGVLKHAEIGAVRKGPPQQAIRARQLERSVSRRKPLPQAGDRRVERLVKCPG